ncbi:late embryogenesis abundant protein (LEA) family protein [Actinidia rufa]|uniref:Late embryogenesis abundant protein (LEA) family protein n=1 Tax=Actinidia rufa TaxID=165716 RepID=A0A7J0G3R6_9ERIC|nr:late embryogenesis abundant protein (LEA) family protein [Actinidia rufa]
MSSAQWNAGQAHGEAQAKTEEWVKSAQNTANKACDKMADSRESAQHGKEQSAGFIQQGAIDGVKNTLGINEKK